MKQSNFGTRYGWALGLITLLGGLLAANATTPTPTATPVPGCPERESGLFFRLTQWPTGLRQGEWVTLEFSVAPHRGVAGLPQYVLFGADEVFDGNTGPVTHGSALPDTVQFHLRASRLGTAELRLQVTYETELCFDGQYFYQFQAVTSDVFSVEVREREDGLPDLVPTRVDIVAPFDCEGHNRLDVCFRNRGGVYLSPFTIELRGSGGESARLRLGVASIGETCIGGPDLIPSTVTVVVDVDDEVLETNETNNVADFEVPAAPPPRPTCTTTPVLSPTTPAPTGTPGAPMSPPTLTPLSGGPPRPTATPLAGGGPLCLPDVELDPISGTAGVAVGIRGQCYWLHSGRRAEIYFDDVLVGEVFGDTPGAYATTFTVPIDALLGAHAVRIVRGAQELASGSFEVTDTVRACVGDCDGDDVVRVDELVAAIEIALHGGGVAACPRYTANPDGTIATAQLVVGLRNALGGCPAALDPATLAGAYDAEVAFSDGEPARAGVAVVQEESAGRLSLDILFDPLTYFNVGGLLQPGGLTRLKGYFVRGGDVLSLTTGTAQASSSTSGRTIGGILDVEDLGQPPHRLPFTLQRPQSGTPARFDGAFRFVLDHAPFGDEPDRSMMIIWVQMPPSGLGFCVATAQVDASGGRLPSVGPGPCFASPQGRFSFRTDYGEGEGLPIEFSGALGDDDVGSGEFWIAAFPHVQEHGTWTAERR